MDPRTCKKLRKWKCQEVWEKNGSENFKIVSQNEEMLDILKNKIENQENLYKIKNIK